MRKLSLVFASILVLSACSSRQEEAKPVAVASPVVAPVNEIKTSNDVKSKYASNFERLTTNVKVKNKMPTFITYEYKDVRIDEIKLLAQRYCQEQGAHNVILRETYLHRSFLRRATFDCLFLQ